MAKVTSKERFPEPATTRTPVTGTTRPPGPVTLASATVNVAGATARSNVTRTAEALNADGRVGLAPTTRGGGEAGMVKVVWYAAIRTPRGSVTLGPTLSV